MSVLCKKMSVPDALTAKLECLFNFSLVEYLEEWPENKKAYLGDKDFFIPLTAGINTFGHYPIKILQPQFTNFRHKARAYVQGKPFQPSLMFAGKAGDYTSYLSVLG